MPVIWHVFGNSGSLLEEPDLATLHPSIGVNHILEFVQPDYYLVVDRDVASRQLPNMRAYRGVILLYDSRPLVRMCHGLKFKKFDLDHRYTHMRRWEGKLSRYGNTGLYALEYAARRIYPGTGEVWLHGIDFCTKKGKPSHFYGSGKARKANPQGWPTHVEKLKKSVDFLGQHGIIVRNASPWRGPLDRILPRVT